MPEYDKPTESVNKIRRSLTQAVWVAPVVTAVTLPVHAQTSSTSSTPPPCTAPAGCYSYTLGGSSAEFLLSFSWPGGGGLQAVEFFSGVTCSLDSSSGPGVVAFVRTADEARALGFIEPGRPRVEPRPPGDCDFYFDVRT